VGYAIPIYSIQKLDYAADPDASTSIFGKLTRPSRISKSM